MKLARKLTLLLVLGIGIIFGVDAWLDGRSYVQLYEDDARRDGLVMGRALAAAVAEAWHEQGEAHALALIEQANERESAVRIRWIELAAPAGDPRAPDVTASELAALREGRQAAHLDRTREPFGRIYTYTPLRIPGRPSSALELSESLAFERHYLAARLRLKLVTAAAMLLTGALVAWLLGVRLVGRPVRSLVETARRIGAGDFKTPLRLRQHDELDELASEMNAMAEQLDLASRKAASETAARIAAVEQLRHADRLTTVGQLASGIAHELGTPLNVVSGRAQMIASGEASDPAQHAELARIIVEQAERMARIVRQLLDFARRRSPEKSPVDLDAIVRQTLMLLRPLASKRRVELAIGAAAAPLEAEVDAAQIQQALTNLVMNAVHATPSGGKVSVGTGLVQRVPPPDVGGAEGGYVWLEVRDEGEGIPTDKLPRIFDPFFTTKPIGEGTGLGLSVAYGIVKEHGGWIDVESRAGEGSCFRVFLPRGGAVERSNPDRR